MPSDRALPAPAHRATLAATLGLDRRLVPRYVLGVAVVFAVIAAAVWPRRQFLGLQRLPAARLHAPDWSLIAGASPAVQLHLIGIALAIGVGLILFAGVKGRALHRVLGWSWTLAMLTAVVSSFFIRIVNHGQLSFIHLLSVGTLFSLPAAVFAARRHRVQMHARTMTGIFIGGLVLAGVFAFMPGRLMWQLFFG